MKKNTQAGRWKCNTFRWLIAAKETTIVFLVQGNSGEKFLTAHASGRNLTEAYLAALAWLYAIHGSLTCMESSFFEAVIHIVARNSFFFLNKAPG